MKAVRLNVLAAAAAMSAAFLALGADEAAVDAAVAKGAKYLLSAQEADGHWSDAQMPALTALPVWALAWSRSDAEGLDEAVSRGVKFVGPVDGELACGVEGAGRMASPVEIFDAAVKS